MEEDRGDDRRVGEEREDLHLTATGGAAERKDLIDAREEHGPSDAGLVRPRPVGLIPALGGRSGLGIAEGCVVSRPADGDDSWT